MTSRPAPTTPSARASTATSTRPCPGTTWRRDSAARSAVPCASGLLPGAVGQWRRHDDRQPESRVSVFHSDAARSPTPRPPALRSQTGNSALVVPAGWSAPSITPGTAGFTTASAGSAVTVAGNTINVTACRHDCRLDVHDHLRRHDGRPRRSHADVRGNLVVRGQGGLDCRRYVDVTVGVAAGFGWARA